MRDKIDVLRKLANKTSSSGLSRIFDSNVTKAINGVRIVDVGQGDCIGILDQQDEVCAYVDFGGYLDHPDKKHPAQNKVRMPVHAGARRVPIIVTHWDQDHIYSAHAYNTDAQKCDWLVPRQWVSPFAARLAAKVKGARCWPESKGQGVHSIQLGSQTVEIRKCEAFDPKRPKEDRNLTGLAITVLDDRRGRLRQMVLPGDCPFHLIPNVQPVPIRHLVAYHHGAKTHWTAMTTLFLTQMARFRSLSYSYSPKNNYGHPERSSYDPDWNLLAFGTPFARSNGEMHVDVKWGP
jgi:hypothetical protein